MTNPTKGETGKWRKAMGKDRPVAKPEDQVPRDFVAEARKIAEYHQKQGHIYACTWCGRHLPQGSERIPETSTNDLSPGEKEEPMSKTPTIEQELTTGNYRINWVNSTPLSLDDILDGLLDVKEPHLTFVEARTAILTLISNAVTEARVEELLGLEDAIRASEHRGAILMQKDIYNWVARRLAELKTKQGGEECLCGQSNDGLPRMDIYCPVHDATQKMVE